MLETGNYKRSVLTFFFKKKKKNVVNVAMVCSAKRFMAAWCVLVGIWIPKEWDLSPSELSQYTKPSTPPESCWIDKPRTSDSTSDTAEKTESKCEEIMVENRPRGVPSYRLVRHVLQSRVEAMNALACFFDELTRAEAGKTVKASPHLAKRYGGGSTEWRYAVEVITFLQKRGAKIPTLRQG